MSDDAQDGSAGARVGQTTQPSGFASIDRTTFFVSAAFIGVVALIGVLFTEQLADVSSSALTWVTNTFGWLFILTATGFVVFALILAFGKYGNIPLSQEGEKPEFSTPSWIAMMFSAGMGIGLMFFGVYEPVSHLAAPPPFVDTEAGSPEAAHHAMAYTFFHWGVHPWAIYAVVGLAIAYSTHRMGRANLVSSAFEGFFRGRRRTPAATKIVDIFAIIATQFGTATSLGFGALQIAAGIALLQTGQITGEASVSTAIVVILVLTSGAAVSAASGVGKGIRYLSNTNMIAAGVLLLFVFVAGPTVFILDLVPAGIGAYVSNFLEMSLRSSVFGGTEWLASWTIFYWAWWVSWAPYVGTFIAKISRGRSIREFVVGALFTPTAVGVIWFSVFGGTGIDLQRNGVDVAGTGSEEEAFFVALGELPLSTVSTVVAVVLISIFFITSADSGGVVLGTLSTRGSEEPWKPIVVFWVFLSGAVAAVLLLIGGLVVVLSRTVLGGATGPDLITVLKRTGMLELAFGVALGLVLWLG